MQIKIECNVALIVIIIFFNIIQVHLDSLENQADLRAYLRKTFSVLKNEKLSKNMKSLLDNVKQDDLRRKYKLRRKKQILISNKLEDNPVFLLKDPMGPNDMDSVKMDDIDRLLERSVVTRNYKSSRESDPIEGVDLNTIDKADSQIVGALYYPALDGSDESTNEVGENENPSQPQTDQSKFNLFSTPSHDSSTNTKPKNQDSTIAAQSSSHTTDSQSSGSTDSQSSTTAQPKNQYSSKMQPSYYQKAYLDNFLSNVKMVPINNIMPSYKSPSASYLADDPLMKSMKHYSLRYNDARSSPSPKEDLTKLFDDLYRNIKFKYSFTPTESTPKTLHFNDRITKKEFTPTMVKNIMTHIKGAVETQNNKLSNCKTNLPRAYESVLTPQLMSFILSSVENVLPAYKQSNDDSTSNQIPTRYQPISLNAANNIGDLKNSFIKDQKNLLAATTRNLRMNYSPLTIFSKLNFPKRSDSKNISGIDSHSKTIDKDSFNSSSAIEEILKIVQDMREKEKKLSENLQCNISGVWSSMAGGMLIKIVVEKDAMNLSLIEKSPPSEKGFLINKKWILKGVKPIPEIDLLIVIGTNVVSKRIAVFIGECRVCGGGELITGNWLIGRSSRNCQEQKASQDLLSDIWKREESLLTNATVNSNKTHANAAHHNSHTSNTTSATSTKESTTFAAADDITICAAANFDENSTCESTNACDTTACTEEVTACATTAAGDTTTACDTTTCASTTADETTTCASTTADNNTTSTSTTTGTTATAKIAGTTATATETVTGTTGTATGTTAETTAATTATDTATIVTTTVTAAASSTCATETEKPQIRESAVHECSQPTETSETQAVTTETSNTKAKKSKAVRKLTLPANLDDSYQNKKSTEESSVCRGASTKKVTKFFNEEDFFVAENDFNTNKKSKGNNKNKSFKVKSKHKTTATSKKKEKADKAACKEDETTTCKEERTTKCKEDGTTTCKEEGTTTCKEDRTTTCKDDATTPCKEDGTTTCKEEGSTTCKEEGTTTCKEDESTTCKEEETTTCNSTSTKTRRKKLYHPTPMMTV